MDEAGHDESSGSSDDAGFIKDGTGGCLDLFECSVQDQDCCDGEACKARANDGGDSWNATICTPLAAEAGQLGDPCVAEGSAVSGNDTCDLGLMCWNVDPQTLEGTCAQYCVPDGDEPLCASADETCIVANRWALPLCLPACDPLTPECGPGFGCYPGSENDFVCMREGEEVDIDGLRHPDCPAGTLMVLPSIVEGCSDDAPCCASFCDQTAVSPCGGTGECLPYFAVAVEINPLGYCSVAS